MNKCNKSINECYTRLYSSLSLSLFQYEYQMYVRCKQSIWNVIYSNIHPKKCKNSKKHVHVLMLVFFFKNSCTLLRPFVIHNTS